MVEKKMNDRISATKKSLEDLGEQVKSLLKGVKADIEDYRFTVSTETKGISIEFFVKASLKKKKA